MTVIPIKNCRFKLSLLTIQILFFWNPDLDWLDIYIIKCIFYKNIRGRLWRVVWLWRISGGYSQEMMGLVLGGYSEEESHLYVYINVTEY